MGPQDVPTSVRFQEILNAVRAEFDNVSCAIGISDEVWLDAQVLIAVGGVRPQNVHDELLLWC